MNDGIYDSTFDTDSAENVGDIGESENSFSESSETESIYDSDNSSDNVSDALGDNSILSTDTESSTEDIEDNQVVDTPDSVQTTVLGSESTSEVSVDYLPELEYIDYLLNEQLNTMKSTVSGNCINVTLDSGSLQALTDIRENQIVIQNNIQSVSVLVSCIIFALCAEFLFNSAKRVVKNITNRKD